MLVGLLAASLAPTAGVARAGGVPPAPIPQDPLSGSVEPFLGAARDARPVDAGPRPPRHPYMAQNGRSNIHEDAYQSDTSPFAGPLGRRTGVTSTFHASECASVTFDAKGRIVTVCVGVERPTLRLMHPRTLETLASYPLPPRQPQSVPGLFTSFGGGGYFYLDHRDRAVVPTNDGHIYVLKVTDSALGPQSVPQWTLVRDHDVSSHVGDDSIVSALPDWSGNLWYVTSGGTVGTVRAGISVDLHEPISNSFAVDDTGGVLVVTDKALYRLEYGSSNGRDAVTIDWRKPYDRGSRKKPGQTQQGSGTTPTIIKRDGRRYVAITDNADPRMHVLVFRARRDEPPGKPVCSTPVFPRGRGSTDNSLIAVGNGIIVENNYGYSGPVSGDGRSPTTEPGVTRVNVDYADGGCRVAWQNQTVRVPSSVSKANPATGLLYVYSHPAADEVRYRSDAHVGDADPWYLTALSLRTGRHVWSRLTGDGTGYNNNYAPITVGPRGTAYVGALGGLIAVRDSTGGTNG